MHKLGNQLIQNKPRNSSNNRTEQLSACKLTYIVYLFGSRHQKLTSLWCIINVSEHVQWRRETNKRTFCLWVSVAVHMQCYGLSRLSRTHHNIDTTIHRHSHHFALQLTQRWSTNCIVANSNAIGVARHAHIDSYTLRNGINKARQNGLVHSDIQN